MLGYSAAQFRQIVLLPQGKFEAFLAADTKDRLKILRQLFDVSHDDDPVSTPQAVILAWWIARSLNLDEAATAEARRLAGRRGVPR